MRGISLLAIILGGVSDVVLSTILGVPLVIYTISTHGLHALPKSQLQSAVTSAIHSDLLLYAAQLAIGTGCSVLGGVIAAAIAKERRVVNGVLAAWLCVGIGAYSLVSGSDTTSPATHIALVITTPIWYLLGAVLRTKLGKAALRP
jgi:hypothetical protein